jgi:hypothetical protein
MIKRITAALAILTMVAFGARADIYGPPPTSSTPQSTCTPTDTSGGGLTLTNVSCRYSVSNGIVHVFGTLTYPATANGNGASISLPVSVPNQSYAVIPGEVVSGSATAGIKIVAVQNSSNAVFKTTANANVTNANLTGQFVNFHLMYPAQ